MLPNLYLHGRKEFYRHGYITSFPVLRYAKDFIFPKLKSFLIIRNSFFGKETFLTHFSDDSSYKSLSIISLFEDLSQPFAAMSGTKISLFLINSFVKSLDFITSRATLASVVSSASETPARRQDHQCLKMLYSLTTCQLASLKLETCTFLEE